MRGMGLGTRRRVVGWGRRAPENEKRRWWVRLGRGVNGNGGVQFVALE